MARIVVIGGSGHVGSYLLPALVERGHEVLNVSRGTASPYRKHAGWEAIEHVALDRKAEEAEGRFGARIADLNADIVVDMISFELEGAQQLVEALRGKIEHYLFCSSIWVYGQATTVPSVETDPTNAIDEYGVNKAKIERWLLQQARRDGFPATSFRPGHIVGEGWVPINPQANANPDVFSQMLRGYAEAMYRWFEQKPRLSFAPFDQWKLGLTESDAHSSSGHILRSSCVSIQKSQQRLGYQPRFSSLESIQQSVKALIACGRVTVPKVAAKG